MWIAINLFLAFYIVPLVAAYITMQLAHKYVWPSTSPDASDVALVLVPFLNMIGFISLFCLLVKHFYVKKQKAKGKKVRTFSQAFFRWRDKDESH